MISHNNWRVFCDPAPQGLPPDADEAEVQELFAAVPGVASLRLDREEGGGEGAACAGSATLVRLLLPLWQQQEYMSPPQEKNAEFVRLAVAPPPSCGR
jgi:hypothetical protein